MLELSLKLVLAHLIGDFLLQPNNWVKNKEKNKIKSKHLYLHVGLHFLLLLTLTEFKLKYLITVAIITISHFIIDTAKLYLEKKNNSRFWFFVDQFLHFLVIAIVVHFYFPLNLKISNIYSSKNLILATTLIGATYVTAIILKILLTKWSIQIEQQNSDTNSAGKYIGILERLFIFFFVIINFWPGIGFLLGAKSIFRFGDLTKAKDVKLTEYILIGTLLSFGLGIFFAMLYKHLISLIVN